MMERKREDRRTQMTNIMSKQSIECLNGVVTT